MSTLRKTTAPALLGMLGALVALPAAAQAPPTEGPAALQVVLDSSGSMAADDPAGGTKIDAAKGALRAVVDALPDGAELGVRAYGGQFPDKQRGCTDTRLVSPMGPLDKGTAKASFAALQPIGFTPIAVSLQAAADDFSNEGPRRILLVSDGEETCGGDPCEVARALERSGIDLTVDTVGYTADAATRAQLTCIAEATGGSYSEAADGPSLATALASISRRAFEGYTSGGTPITGGPIAAQAVPVRPGQYLDALTQGEKKFYVVDLPEGITPYIIASLARPDGKAVNDASKIEYDQVQIQLLNRELEQCERAAGGDYVFGAARLASTTLRTEPVGTGAADGNGDNEKCGLAGESVIQLTRTANNRVRTGGLPVELVVLFEPPVKNATSLPAPLTERGTDLPAPQVPRTGRAVKGGATLNEAPNVTSGETVADGIRAGETRYFRVPVGWGQRAVAAAQFDALSEKLPSGSSLAEMDIRIYDPVRRQVPAEDIADASSLYSPGASYLISTTTPEIRWRNRESDDDKIVKSSLAGEHYISVTLEVSDELQDAVVPFRMRVDVTGEVTGEPDYQQQPDLPAEPATPTAPSAASGDESAPAADGDAAPPAAAARDAQGDGPPWRAIGYVTGGSAAALAALALLVLPLLRRRRSL